jgi:hypothetical protein
MTSQTFNNLVHGMALAALAIIAVPCSRAQEENERLSASTPLENSIAHRDVAFRWRWEVQDTHDSQGALDADPSLALYPTRMVSSELKMFTVNGATAFGMYDQWQNDQDLDVFRASAGAGIPLGEWRVDAKATYFDRETYNDTQYYYLSAGRPVGDFYTYSQYRLSLDGKNVNNGFVSGNQLSEYLSWTPVKSFRLGVQGACCAKENDDDSGYLRVFTARSFFDYATSVRLEALQYESRLYPDYREVKGYLYQRLNAVTLARLSYRHYADNRHNESHGPGLKVIYFLSPRVACHLGYVRYIRRNGPDFDSFLGGMNVIF